MEQKLHDHLEQLLQAKRIINQARDFVFSEGIDKTLMTMVSDLENLVYYIKEQEAISHLP